MTRIRMALLVAAFVAAGANGAIAQTALAQDVPPAVEEVFVRATDGVEIRGRLIDFGPASLSIFVEGARREMPLGGIDRIERRGDSLRNGALIGAAVGAALGASLAARHGAEYGPLMFVGAVGYGVVGAAVDAMIPGRTAIYAKPRSAVSTTGGKRVGLALRIGF